MDINVFYCVDSSSIGRRWLGFSIKSLFQVVKDTSSLHIFVASDTPYENPHAIWIDANPYIKTFNLSKISQVTKNGRHPSPMQIFRIVAPWVTELNHISKLLYLDIDTEVVSPSFSDVLEKEFDADVLAVQEHSKHGDESSVIMLSKEELYDLMSNATQERLKVGGYFNSGVMVMNLTHLREHHTDYVSWCHMVVDMAVKHHRKVVDQDICNVVLDALPLDSTMNVMPDTDVPIPSSSPKVIHYANTAKYRERDYPPINVSHSVYPFKNIDYVPLSRPSQNQNDISIPWEKWFDKIYCLFYLPNGNRLPRIMKELKRVDLASSSIFELRHMVPQKMEEIVLLASRKVKGGCDRLFAVGLGMENIRVMKESLLLGHKRIMIIEDDAVFLKDKSQIIDILNSMPPNYNILQMDKAVRGKELSPYQEIIYHHRINPYFVDSSSRQFDLSTCNIYTKRGMELAVAALEYRMGIIDTITKFIPDEPAMAIDNLAIQVVYNECHTKDFYSKVSLFHELYKYQGIDYSRYAVPEGYSYGSVLR